MTDEIFEFLEGEVRFEDDVEMRLKKYK